MVSSRIQWKPLVFQWFPVEFNENHWFFNCFWWKSMNTIGFSMVSGRIQWKPFVFQWFPVKIIGFPMVCRALWHGRVWRARIISTAQPSDECPSQRQIRARLSVLCRSISHLGSDTRPLSSLRCQPAYEDCLAAMCAGGAPQRGSDCTNHAAPFFGSSRVFDLQPTRPTVFSFPRGVGRVERGKSKPRLGAQARSEVRATRPWSHFRDSTSGWFSPPGFPSLC